MEVALSDAAESYAHALSKALAACRQLHQVFKLLQVAAATVLDYADPSGHDVEIGLEEQAGLQQQWQQLHTWAERLGQGQTRVRACFYGRPFQEFGEVLLSIVGPDWRPSFTREQDESLFLRFFREAPAAVCLTVLIMHLSSVELPSQPLRRGRASFAAVSAEVACELLSERFGYPSSPGLQQLLDSMAAQWAGGGDSGPAGVATQRQAQAQELQAEVLAAALASIPDRSAVCDAPLLQPATFLPLLVARMLTWLQRLRWPEGPAPRATAEGEAAGAEGTTGGNGAGSQGELTDSGGKEAAWSRGLAFASDLASRLSRRGHAHHVAAALVEAMRGELGPASGLAVSTGCGNDGQNSDGAVLAVAARVVAGMADAGALEKLVESFLRLLACEAAGAGASASGSSVGDSSSGSGSSSPGPAASRAAADEPAGGEGLAGGGGRGGGGSLGEGAAVRALRALLPPATWASRPELRYALMDKLLLQRVLPAPALRWLVEYLDTVADSPGRRAGPCSAAEASGSSSSSMRGPGSTDSGQAQAVGQGAAGAGSGGGGVLGGVACQLARVWGDPSCIQRLPVPQQAFLTAALQECMVRLGPARFQACPELLPAVLQGVGARLESPLQAVRRQGMRVGHQMSLLLDASKPLFEEDRPWELLPGEHWEQGAPEQRAAASAGRLQPAAAARRAAVAGGDRGGGGAGLGAGREREGEQKEGEGEGEWPLTETDSDDELDAGPGSGDELKPYDLEESDEEDVTKAGLQLRDLTSRLLNGEKDWRGQLRALRGAEALIRAAPDELEHYGVPLARALLHTPLPKWAAEEAKAGEEPPDMQRFSALVALVSGVPSRAGLALASEFYSPSLDIHHRDLVLSTLSTAAQELARPGSFLRPLPGVAVPASSVVAPGQLGAASVGGGPSGRAGAGAGAPGRAGRVTRVSERALASRSGRAQAQGHVNRFPAVALPWAATLLRECDRQHQGVDLFGRDAFLLGRLLVTLGTFVECCTHAPQCAPLAAAVLELVKSHRVYDSPEPYVRRASLLAASQVMAALPPARLSSAMLGAAAAAGLEDSALVRSLDWVSQWAEGAAGGDPDEGCRKMAASCRRLQASLAAGALAALEEGAGAGPGGLLGGGGPGRELLPAPPARQGVRVALPRLEELRLK